MKIQKTQMQGKKRKIKKYKSVMTVYKKFVNNIEIRNI